MDWLNARIITSTDPFRMKTTENFAAFGSKHRKFFEVIFSVVLIRNGFKVVTKGLRSLHLASLLIGHVRIRKIRFNVKSTMFLRTIVVVGMQCSGAPSGWWLRRRGSCGVVASEWGGWCWGMTPSSPAAPTSGTATTRRQWGSRSCCCGRCCRRRWRWPMTRRSTGLVVIRGHHILALKTQCMNDFLSLSYLLQFFRF